MTNKRYNKIKSEADKKVKKIDKFIDDLTFLDDYGTIPLILKRLLKKASDYDLENMRFELELEGIKTFKIDSLAQEYKFEQFLTDLETNPYQLQLIA